MRRVESSFLRRSLVLAWIAAITVGVVGCVWHDGQLRGPGWGFHDRNDRSGHDDHRDRDRHHDGDRDDDRD